ncbi:MAG: hypothetical protein R3F21_04640 [Myxococcota bacterium]
MPAESWILWLGSISILVLIASVFALPWLVTRIPEDYFCHPRRAPASWEPAHPAVRIGFLVLKNLLGFVLLAGGFILLFVPGQGLLTMAVGLLLIDYPGKFALERRVVAIEPIFKGLNWLRRRRGIAPLKKNP